DVGVGQDGGVARHVAQLRGSVAPAEDVHLIADRIGDQPGSQPNRQQQKRSDDEIPGPGRHDRGPQVLIRSGLGYCSSTYSRSSTARPAAHNATAVMAASHATLASTGGTSRKT